MSAVGSLVALCQGLLIVCFYRPMLVAISRWEGLDGIAPPALLVLLVAAVVPLFIVLALTEAATQIFTVVTSVENMIDARTIAKVTSEAGAPVTSIVSPKRTAKSRMRTAAASSTIGSASVAG